MRRNVQKFYIRLVTLVAAILLLVPVVPTVRAASGSCGKNVSWELNGGVLTISGKGAMTDYQEFTPAPWAKHAEEIRSVIIEKGVTNVGNYAFFAMENITAVSLADSVTKVGKYAFYNCGALSLLELGKGVKVLSDGAFERCKSLLFVRLPNGLEKISYHAFYRCESLQTITVPASVTEMGSAVFGYCYSLKNVSVLAKIKELPAWTFYSCEKLSAVTLSSTITDTGMDAFKGCDVLQPPAVSGGDTPPVTAPVTNKPADTKPTTGKPAATDPVTGKPAGETTASQSGGSVTPNSFITIQVAGKKTIVTAIVESAEGWDELIREINKIESQELEVIVHIKGAPEVKGKQLGSFADREMLLTIHTRQGAVWHMNTKDLKKDQLRKNYDLSFTLKAQTDPTEAQAKAVRGGKAFTVVFATPVDFKVQVELPLGQGLAGSVAALFAPNGKKFDRMQDVRLDNQGAAHFYLQQIAAKTEYLIGIDVTDPDAGSISNAILPDSIVEQYGNVEQVEEIEYVVLSPKSSWGLDIGQVTWILVGVMGGSVIVVGVVIGIMNKRKLKKGYIPELDEDEDDT